MNDKGPAGIEFSALVACWRLWCCILADISCIASFIASVGPCFGWDASIGRKGLRELVTEVKALLVEIADLLAGREGFVRKSTRQQ